MSRTTTLATGVLTLSLAGFAPAAAQHHGDGDHAGVERAAMDYLEGFYEGSTEKLERSVHPDVAKFGFFRPSADEEYERSPMSFQGMLDFATNVRESGNFPSEDAPKRVVVLDVLDQTAVVKVYAWWGSDYAVSPHD